MVMVFAFHILLLAGLSTMLLDGWGWLAFAVYSIGMPFGALGVWLYYDRSIRDIRIARIPDSLPVLIKGFALALLIPGSIFALIVLVGWAEIVDSKLNITLLVTSIILPQVLVATAEEFAFRGVTQSLLTTRVGAARALAITAFLFGVFHLPNVLYNDVPTHLIPLTIASLTVMGWVFGDAYLRAGNRLALPTVLHLGWNIASFGIEPLFDYDFSGPTGLIGVAEWFPESGVFGGIGLIVLGTVIRRFFASTAPPA